MSSAHVVELPGCRPEPLMSYLKALGVLRIVSEQLDPMAAGYWQNNCFVLQTSAIHALNNPQVLIDFFTRDYRPTPILAPWNGGCGFYKKWDPKECIFKSREAVRAVEKIERSTSLSFKPYRKQIICAKQALESLADNVDLESKCDAIRKQGYRNNWSEGKIKSETNKYLDGGLLFEIGDNQKRIDKANKDGLVRLIRNKVLDDEALRWLDAAMVLLTGHEKNRIESPLLGSGGNIGNSEFSARYMQLMMEVLSLSQSDPVPSNCEPLLRASLFDNRVTSLLNVAVDQFNPGMAGGANMGQGMVAKPLLNPWDYILMVEGSLLLVGAATRRLDAKDTRSSFPFAVDSCPVFFGSAGQDKTRGELWLPLWDRPCSLKELAVLLAEGRAETGARRATNAVEFARAIAALGVDRGITKFVRLQFQQRLGDNYLASVLGHMNVKNRENVYLLNQLDSWIEQYRRSCSAKETPSRFRAALRRIEAKIFDYCRYGDSSDLLGVLIALGMAERELAVTGGHRGGKQICRPIQNLSVDWINATNDGSAEFEIALSLAGLQHGPDFQGKESIPPLRTNLEPVQKGKSWVWDKVDRAVVWKAGGLAENLVAVLERRLLGGGAPSIDFHHGIRIQTVGRFIAGDTNDRRIEDLLWALTLIRTAKGRNVQFTSSGFPPPFPRAFALLKPLFLPRPIHFYKGRWQYTEPRSDAVRIQPEPRVLPLLRAERVPEACEIAVRRLLVSGLKPMPSPAASGIMRQVDIEIQSNLDPTRLAASLLLPVRNDELNRLLRLVTRPPEETSVS